MVGHGKIVRVYQAEAEALGRYDLSALIPLFMCKNRRESAPNSPCSGCPRVDASHKAHICQTTVSHRPSWTSTSPTGRLHSHYLSPSSVGPHNDLGRNHSNTALSHPFLTNIDTTEPPHQRLTSRPKKKHPFNLHTTLHFAEFIRNSTRSQTGKMAAVDETFSTLVRIVPSITLQTTHDWTIRHT